MQPAMLIVSLLALASCQLGVPSEGDIQQAMETYLDLPWPPAVEDFDDLRDARLANVNDCTPQGGYFICASELVLSDGRQVAADIWLSRRYPSGWQVSSIVPTETE